jgi:hypothetical protein
MQDLHEFREAVDEKAEKPKISTADISGDAEA